MISDYANSETMPESSLAQSGTAAIAGSCGTLLGGLIGRTVGSFIGTLIAPGSGTATGAAVGAFAGRIVGGLTARWFASSTYECITSVACHLKD